MAVLSGVGSVASGQLLEVQVGACVGTQLKMAVGPGQSGPAPQTPCASQTSGVAPQVWPVRGTHAPVPTAQAWHSPVHALSQQTPPTQIPLAQLVVGAQSVPFGTGGNRDESPNCPRELSPQQKATPSVVNAHVWYSPAAMAVTPVSPGTVVGERTSLVPLLPT